MKRVHEKDDDLDYSKMYNFITIGSNAYVTWFAMTIPYVAQ